MAKKAALGADLLVGGYRLGNDIGSVQTLACPVGVQDTTGLDKSARETLLLLRDGVMTFAPFFNPADDRAHEVLGALPRSDVICTFLVGTTQGSATYSLSGKQNNYDGTRAQSGELTFTTTANGNGWGADWGIVLSEGITASTGAENLDSVDGAAATNFGLQAYLHVLAFTGTSVTATIQDSANNTDFAAVTAGAFTAATAVGAQRIQTARDATIRRYLRVALTGTYSAATVLVAVNRNKVLTPL